MTMQKNPVVSVSKNEAEVFNIATNRVNERHEAIRRDISTRLRASCTDLSDEAFTALVDKMLKVQITSEARWH